MASFPMSTAESQKDSQFYAGVEIVIFQRRKIKNISRQFRFSSPRLQYVFRTDDCIVFSFVSVPTANQFLCKAVATPSPHSIFLHFGKSDPVFGPQRPFKRDSVDNSNRQRERNGEGRTTKERRVRQESNQYLTHTLSISLRQITDKYLSVGFELKEQATRINISISFIHPTL